MTHTDTDDNWKTAAACHAPDVDPNWFFVTELYPYAHRICCRCPVVTPCLEHALEHEDHGYWGDTTERQRRRLRAQRDRPRIIL